MAHQVEADLKFKAKYSDRIPETELSAKYRCSGIV